MNFTYSYIYEKINHNVILIQGPWNNARRLRLSTPWIWIQECGLYLILCTTININLLIHIFPLCVLENYLGKSAKNFAILFVSRIFYAASAPGVKTLDIREPKQFTFLHFFPAKIFSVQIRVADPVLTLTGSDLRKKTITGSDSLKKTGSGS